LEPEGKTLLFGLVDLLEAATHGMTAGRVPGLVCGDSARQNQRMAQRALRALITPQPGARLSIATNSYESILLKLREYVKRLQTEWKTTEDLPTLNQRLARLRKAHRKDFDRFFKSETDLVCMLKRDNPLQSAARLAEKITGRHQDLFLRALRDRRGQWEGYEGSTDSFLRGLGENSAVSQYFNAADLRKLVMRHNRDRTERAEVFAELNALTRRSRRKAKTVTMP
jgi:hypothetical protein